MKLTKDQKAILYDILMNSNEDLDLLGYLVDILEIPSKTAKRILELRAKMIKEKR